jgi:hypothetical protein
MNITRGSRHLVADSQREEILRLLREAEPVGVSRKREDHKAPPGLC